MLERTQKGGLDVTAWQEWFLSCLHRAIEGSHSTLGTVLAKARFWGAGIPGGIIHFGFRLIKPEDIDVAIATVESAGGTVNPPAAVGQIAALRHIRVLAGKRSLVGSGKLSHMRFINAVLSAN